MTPETQTVMGTARPPAGRRPKLAEPGRVCSTKSCRTRLSRFNLADRCHLHRRRRFPRIRGITLEERREMGLEV